MSPYPAAPPSEEILAEVIEQQTKTASPQRVAPSSSQQSVLPAPRGRNWLSESLLEMSPTCPGRRTVDFVLSLIVHAIFLGTLLLIPLYFTEAIDLKQFTQTFLVAPPPPPPPPPPASPVIAKVASAPKRIFTATGKLLAPTVIPEKIAMLKEEPLPPDVGPTQGVVGGVPGGVPGGQIGGVLGGVLSGARTNIPVAPTAPPKAPVRVGGRIRAPKLVSQVNPVYPVLARRAKIEGQVLIDSVIDEHGNIVEMQVVSGHPLLIPAAVDAVRKWKYEPTYLNDQPVPVQLVVTVFFRLE